LKKTKLTGIIVIYRQTKKRPAYSKLMPIILNKNREETEMQKRESKKKRYIKPSLVKHEQLREVTLRSGHPRPSPVG
jgi:hypothetical protein